MNNNIKIIKSLKDKGAIFVINHSGGKDSQAMYLYLTRIQRVPEEQIKVVHAILPGADWDGIESHIKATIGNPDGLITVTAKKTFFDMVRAREMFPSPQFRQCTSDLKMQPINKWLRQYSNNTGQKLFVNCLGIRAEESSQRAKQKPFVYNKRLSANGRKVFNFYPIFDFPVDKVKAIVAMHGQTLHPAYQAGMTRLSCCFCIMASKRDLRTARKLKPSLFAEYVALEEEINHTMFTKNKKPVSLENYIKI